MRHNLKIESRWLAPVRTGEKKAEIRNADRDFSVGDELLLYTPDQAEAELVRVTHILPLSEVPGHDAHAALVSLSVELMASYSGGEVVGELAKGDYGHPVL